MSDLLIDGRTPWFSVHSAFDETVPWSVDAYRVYGHLSRRCGDKDSAFPSYRSIGETCFRFDYKDKTPKAETLRNRAIRAVSELNELGLVSVQKRYDSERGKHKSNIYVLTHTSEWTFLVNSDNHLVNSDNPLSYSTEGIPLKEKPPIVPQANEQPEEGGFALLPTAEQPVLGQSLNASQASPVKRIEAVGEGECSAAAPHPGNFERTRYGKAPSPIMSHYGMGHMVVGRDGVNLKLEPRLVRGMRKIGQDWPGSYALTSDGKAIAYIRKMLSQLTQPQHFEAAWARLELAWEEGAESAVVPMKRLSQFEELVAQYGSPMGGAA